MSGFINSQQQVSFTNERGHVAVQAGQYNVYGTSIVQYAQDPLKQLPHAVEAPFNTLTKQDEPICLPDTRVDLLREIHSWADGQDERCLFWLRGLAGTGKSTIARTVARRYFEQQRLGASFFFETGGRDVSHADKFVTSIAVQLAYNVPACRQHICNAVAERNDIPTLSLRDQWHHFVLRPLSKLDGLSSYVLVVDALDECDNDSNIRIIINLLAEVQSLERFRLRIFLTSRPEVPVRNEFCKIPDAEHQDFVLHNISPSTVDHDITVFFEHSFRLIAQDRCLFAGWPGADDVEQLVQNASGLFIWAATACRFIREGGQFVDDRLRAILNDSSFTDDSPTDGSSTDSSSTDDSSAIPPEKRLNNIYLTVLMNPVRRNTGQEKRKWYKLIRETLGAIILLFSPLSASSLVKLLDVSEGDIDQKLNELHSILDVPQDQTRPVRLHHPSFREFLLNKDRCGPNFWVADEQAHQKLAGSCIRLMNACLKQDICSIDSPGSLVAEVRRTQVEQCLPSELQYACLYWIQHLVKSGAQLSNNDYLHKFLKEHFLHWLEALSWMGKVLEGIYAINALESIALAGECPDLYAFVHDMKRFALYNRSAIEQAPLQVYCSALVFAPSISVVKKQFLYKVPQWIRTLPEVGENWDALLQTVGDSNGIKAVAFSPNGRVLASASTDTTVRLWDTSTGTVLQMLTDHSSLVTAVVFSPDGKVLASASWDKTVKLWDVSKGTVKQTLRGHSNTVTAVAFSPDGKVLASSSWDTRVRLWDALKGVVLRNLEGHQSQVNAVAFSPDGKVLALASKDMTVKLWDTARDAVLQTLMGHRGSVTAVAFSPDSNVLASTSESNMKLWDIGTATGTVQQGLMGHPRFEGHLRQVNAVAFSPDGKVLASASLDWTVKLWDAGTGAVLRTLRGHLDRVNSVAFSPDGEMLASASHDKTVKLWNAGTGALLWSLEGHVDNVNVVAFSLDGKVLASGSYDMKVKLWDVDKGTMKLTLNRQGGFIIAVVFSPDGKVLASASLDKTVKLWDVSTGAVRQTLRGHLNTVIAVAFSLDSKVLASASRDETVKLWDAATGTMLRTLQFDGAIETLSFSSNDRMSLETDRGVLCTLFSPGEDIVSQNLSCQLFLKEQWIGRGKSKMLWLPPEYRSRCTAVYKDVVALGHTSGRLSVLELAF